MPPRPKRKANASPPKYKDGDDETSGTTTESDHGDAKFVPAGVNVDGKAVYCAQEKLDHSSVFQGMFAIGERPIKITRDFELFKSVIKFAKDSSQNGRYAMLQDEDTRDDIISELEHYGVATEENCRGYIDIQEQIGVKNELVKALNKSKVPLTGLARVFTKTLARDIDPPDKHLILKLLVSQGKLYHKTMYSRRYNSVYAQKPYLAWFMDPDHLWRNIDKKKYKLPDDHEKPSWLTFDMRALSDAKDKLKEDISTELPQEVFSTDGIDALFDCSASYNHTVDLVLLMQSVLIQCNARLEMCTEAGANKSHIKMIRKYLSHPCKTILGKD